MFRVDYSIRCEKKDKETISRNFRVLYRKYENRVSLEDDIFEIWKNELQANTFLISNLKSVFKYRHWLAHGRYWTLKAGKPQYDFSELYILALQLNNLPLKKNS